MTSSNGASGIALRRLYEALIDDDVDHRSLTVLCSRTTDLLGDLHNCGVSQIAIDRIRNFTSLEFVDGKREKTGIELKNHMRHGFEIADEADGPLLMLAYHLIIAQTLFLTGRWITSRPKEMSLAAYRDMALTARDPLVMNIFARVVSDPYVT